MHDVGIHARVVGDVGEAARGFGFGYFGLREVVVERRELPGGPVLGDERVNHVAVGGVGRHEAAMLLNLLHQAHHLRVVNHKRALVSHKGFERGDAFGNHVLDFLLGAGVEIGHGHMEAVIAHGIAGGPAAPFLEGRAQRIALLLQDEVDDGGGAAVQGGAGTGFVGIGRKRAHKGHFEVHVRVDAAGHDELAGAVDDLRAFGRQVAAEGYDGFAFNQNIADGIGIGGDDAAVFEEDGHVLAGHLTPGPSP